MYFKGTLTLVSSKDNQLRTQSIDGTFEDLPQKNWCFLIVGEPLNPAADARLVRTSYVQEVTEISPWEIEFKTMNSTYRLVYEQNLDTVLAAVN